MPAGGVPGWLSSLLQVGAGFFGGLIVGVFKERRDTLTARVKDMHKTIETAEELGVDYWSAPPAAQPDRNKLEQKILLQLGRLTRQINVANDDHASFDFDAWLAVKTFRRALTSGQFQCQVVVADQKQCGRVREAAEYLGKAVAKAHNRYYPLPRW